MMTMTTEELVEKLRRPMYNFNMAPIPDDWWHPRLKKSCITRRKNALAEIHQLALEYVKSGGAPSKAFKNRKM